MDFVVPRIALVSVALGALILAVIIPALELNSTHITNPEWPPHARLHEAWQLLTNAGISLLALACVWSAKAPRLGIGLDLWVCVSFLSAWAFGPVYGGSMLHSDGPQIEIAGLNLVVLVVMVVTTLLLTSLWKTSDSNRSKTQEAQS